MYVVCLKDDGRFIRAVDCEGLSVTSDLDLALSVDSEFKCMVLIMFVVGFFDCEFVDFYIQFYPEHSPS